MGNGLTMEQMNQRMYTALVGIDGKGGIVKDIADAKQSRKTIYDKVDSLEDRTITKEECASFRKHAVSEKRNKWLVVKDILLIVVGPSGGAVAVILLAKVFGG